MDTKYGSLLYFCIGWTHMDNRVIFFLLFCSCFASMKTQSGSGLVNNQSVVWLIEAAEQDSAPSGGS